VRYKLASCSCHRQSFARALTGAFFARALTNALQPTGLLGRCALALLIGLWFRTPHAQAQPAPRQLSVLHAAVVGVSESDVARVDRALQDTLATQRRQSSVVQTSPVPFEDVQLIAGCGADETACLQLIANQLGSDALLVRRLVAQPGGRAVLTLIAYATQPGVTAAPPREVSGIIDWTEAQGAELTVRQLMGQLSPPPPEPVREVLPPVAAAAPAEPVVSPEIVATPVQTEAPASASPSLWPWRLGWTLSAVGCGLLAGGLISGAAARNDEDAYARTAIVDPASVDRAHARLDDAEGHARLANGLIISGAVITTAGLATVLWRWAAQRSETRDTALRKRFDAASGAGPGERSRASGSTALRLQPTLQPTGSGLMLSIHGSWQGGS
jgi:hypothetical protein